MIIFVIFNMLYSIFEEYNIMGNTNCCKTDSRTGFDSEIIQIHQQQLPQPPAKQTTQQSIRVQQYLSKHQVIRRILRQPQVKQQQEKITNKDTFFSYAKAHQMSDGIFIGQQNLDNRKKNGFGIMIYNDSSFYEGEWKDDMKNGRGVLANESGQYYCGDWVEDYPHGQGIYCILDPYAYYKGQWTQGLKHGQGAQHAQDGSKYVGSFVYGEKEGHGKLIYSDGTQYEGEFKNNKPDGLGKFKGKGHNYEGSWKNGKMHGAGTSCWHDQDNQVIGKYLGQYKQGIKQGYGQYTDSKGTVYRAMWINGEINEHAPVDVQKSG